MNYNLFFILISMSKLHLFLHQYIPQLCVVFEVNLPPLYELKNLILRSLSFSNKDLNDLTVSIYFDFF